ncbi:uncharacterized protein [Eurosta solidaginis]|uniref:uncharacterized protein n=1 Tax=Eurosta solidaginis TaxID=178769 RepID=UPI0035311203
MNILDMELTAVHRLHCSVIVNICSILATLLLCTSKGQASSSAQPNRHSTLLYARSISDMSSSYSSSSSESKSLESEESTLSTMHEMQENSAPPTDTSTYLPTSPPNIPPNTGYNMYPVYTPASVPDS